MQANWHNWACISVSPRLFFQLNANYHLQFLQSMKQRYNWFWLVFAAVTRWYSRMHSRIFGICKRGWCQSSGLCVLMSGEHCSDCLTVCCVGRLIPVVAKLFLFIKVIIPLRRMWCWPAALKFCLNHSHWIYPWCQSQIWSCTIPAISSSLTDTKHKKIAIAQDGGTRYFMGAFHLFIHVEWWIFIYCSSTDRFIRFYITPKS